MQHRVDFMKQLLSLPDLHAAAVVGADRDVLHARFESDLDAVLKLAHAARTVFREVVPALSFVELCFQAYRLVLVPADEQIIVVSVARDVAPAGVVERIKRLLVDTQGSKIVRTEIRPSATIAAVTDEALRAALRAFVERAAAHIVSTLGGPVVRNYLRKAAEELAGEHPWLTKVPVGLDGRADLSALDGIDSATLSRGCAAWVRVLYVRARAVVPDAAGIDFRRLADEHANALDQSDFFKQAEGVKR